VAGLTRRQLSELRGYLGQQPFLYAGSMRDNITLGQPWSTPRPWRGR
jgi:ATP-binding cassette, subfamily C, bacterial CydD